MRVRKVLAGRRTGNAGCAQPGASGRVVDVVRCSRAGALCSDAGQCRAQSGFAGSQMPDGQQSHPAGWWNVAAVMAAASRRQGSIRRTVWFVPAVFMALCRAVFGCTHGIGGRPESQYAVVTLYFSGGRTYGCSKECA